MALVLAITGDPDDADVLADVVRGRVGAELVTRACVEDAFAALDGRVPDLILVPQLLSPLDEAVIASCLRMFGPDAAHVQTVTIPRLAAEPEVLPEPKAQSGLLASLFRQAAQPAPTAPEPVVETFAGQVREYLARALQNAPAVTAVRPPAMEPPPADPPPAGADRQVRPRKRRRRRHATPPAAALFDPNQCEFATLIATFDDVVEEQEQDARIDAFIETME